MRPKETWKVCALVVAIGVATLCQEMIPSDKHAHTDREGDVHSLLPMKFG